MMSVEARLKLQFDARNWLQGVVSRAASETGCQREVTADATGFVVLFYVLDLGIQRYMLAIYT